MKVIIDTNVLVSAALKDKDPEAVILFVVERPEFEWIVSAAILIEYREVLGRAKFNLPEEVLNRWNEIINALTTLIEVNVAVDFQRDRKDEKFLECALAANAEYLITGDKDFHEAQTDNEYGDHLSFYVQETDNGIMGLNAALSISDI